MYRNCLLAALAAVGLGAVAMAPAQLERDHGAHVHGISTGNLSQDGSTLRLELEIPGVNLIGFEHPPRNQDQQRLLDETVAFLDVGEWLVTDARGGCEIDRINAHTHGFDADHGGDHGHHDDHSHDHGHRKDHGHEHDHEGRHRHDHGHHDDHGHNHHDHDHAEFHVIAYLNCETPEALRWVDIRLFDDYPGNERIAIDVLTDQVATRARLTAASQRINLTR